MANIDAGLGAPPRERPRAIVEAYRSSIREEQPAPPPRPVSRPKFSRVDSGQLIRSLILVILCLGVVQLSHAEKGGDGGNGPAAPARRL
jgi:hypothetical protein